MLIIGIVNSSSLQDSGIKVDINLFVQKPYVRTEDNECSIEEGIEMKNDY